MRARPAVAIMLLGFWLAVTPLAGVRSESVRGILDPERFHEIYKTVVALSGGGFIHGIAIGDLNPLVQVDRIAIDFQGGIADRLCVAILSIDGFYSADLEFDISSRPSGTYQVRVPTHYASELNQYRRSEVAISPILSDECGDGQVRGFGAVRWDPSEPGSEVAVLLTTGGARTTLEVPHQEGGVVRYACQPLAAGQSGLPSFYDTVCTAEIAKSLDLRAARLIRYKPSGDPPTHVSIPISLE